jgi:integrase
MAKRPKKQKDGLYHLQRYVGKYPDGSKCYRRFKGANWDDLMVEIATYKKEWMAGMHREECEHGNPPKELTLLDAIDKYIDTCRAMHEQDPDSYSVATIAAYVSYSKSIARHPALATLVSIPISQITVALLQEAINALGRGADGKKLSTKTVNNWYGLIKPALDAYGPDIRLDKIKKAKGKQKPPMIIRDSSIPELLRAARQINDEFFLYVLFSAVLGTRPSESYALTWGDLSASPIDSIEGGVRRQFGTVNIDKACVRDELGVYRDKGTKSEAGTRVLSRHWSFFQMVYSVKPRGRDDERILSMHTNLLPYRWKKLKQLVSIPDDMVMYDLRHYHSTVMDALGASEQYIAADMGHSDIRVTKKHYLEELHEKRQEINNAMYDHTDNLIASINFDTSNDTTENTTQMQEAK